MQAQKQTRQTIIRLLSSMASAKEISQYVKRFSQLDAKRFAVVKVGGAVLRDDLDALTSSLSFLQEVGLTPIVVVLNNQGYGTERPMLDGRFNDILNWRYSEVTRVLGAGRGYEAATEDELETALLAARADRDTFHVIEVRLAPDDRSVALQRLTAALAQRVRS